MKVLIEMPVEVYDGLLDKCDQSCAEYYTLTKAKMFRLPREDHQLRLMRIFCDRKEATRLFALVSRISPDAVPHIKKTIAASPFVERSFHSATSLGALAESNVERSQSKLMGDADSAE